MLLAKTTGHDIKKGCLGKVKHKSLLAAEYVLDEMRDRAVMNIYKCRFCHHYHIGHDKDLAPKKKINESNTTGKQQTNR